MKGNPEDAVIAEINALETDLLIDSQLAAGETPKASVPSCSCGRPWHGLPRNGCPGSHQTGERDLSKESTGVVYVDEIYQLSNVSRGLMQTIPSTFAANPPPADREVFMRQFNDEVLRMNLGRAADFVVILNGYDSPMERLLAEHTGLA